ncbi:MAG: response regulator [Rhodoferax sp.]|nr:MAG: response regulator [Rhodoferax sp.]
MNVFVKTVGFSADERHALQTMFRLSDGQDVQYRLWQPGRMLVPHVVLLDAESHEAALEVQSPTFRPHTKTIVVGDPAFFQGAWKVVSRPLQWKQVIAELEVLFASGLQATAHLHDPTLDLNPASHATIPPGYKTALIIGLPREEQLYLKARLSLQGIAHVVEAVDAGQAAEHLGQQGVDIVVVSSQLPDADAAALIQALKSHVCPPYAIVAVVPHDCNWAQRLQMETAGATGVLEAPFIPHKVGEMFANL